MASSENDYLKEAQKEVDIYEDEINLIDYFIVLWKQKWFISLASALPALMVGLTLFLLPRYYKITYIYDVGLDEKDYRILLDEFYCTENMDKIIAKLKENGFEKYAQRITDTKQTEDLKKFVRFEVFPSFFENAGSSVRTNVEDLKKIQQARGTLLLMTIEGKPQRDMPTIASIVRDDFEKVVPLYSVQEELISNISTLKALMANIEKERFGSELELQQNKAILEKLKSVQQSGPVESSNNIVLQFNDANASSAYLPLAYQVQAANSQIIHLEESIRANEEKFVYYKSLLGINERILSEIKGKISSYYTIQEFHVLLSNVLKDCKDKKLADYLDAYIKAIENKIASTVPVTNNPKISRVDRGTAKKSGIVFAVSLIISVFTAFLLEAIKKKPAQVS